MENPPAFRFYPGLGRVGLPAYQRQPFSAGSIEPRKMAKLPFPLTRPTDAAEFLQRNTQLDLILRADFWIEPRQSNLLASG
jgi:hypothetical protein